MNKKPPCPKCSRTTDVVESGLRDHYCGGCQITFNHDPENDRFFDRDPQRHAERQDDYAAKRRKKFGVRR